MTDEELLEVARDFRSGFDEDPMFGGLVGMCYAISAPLAGLLSFYGVECDLVKSDHSDLEDSQWWEHHWIRLKDGRALDPTFDQFGGDPVYLGEPTRFHRSWEDRSDG